MRRYSFGAAFVTGCIAFIIKLMLYFKAATVTSVVIGIVEGVLYLFTFNSAAIRALVPVIIIIRCEFGFKAVLCDIFFAFAIGTLIPMLCPI